MSSKATIYDGRYAAKLEGDFVVFVIGMRINRLLLPHKWVPVVLAMPRMLKELFVHPEMGMLHAQTFMSGRTLMVLQYWRSFEQLNAYAHGKELQHLPAWADFNRRVGGNGSVGIFHETYVVGPGKYECVYANMPRFGLAKQARWCQRQGACSMRSLDSTRARVPNEIGCADSHRSAPSCTGVS